MAPQHGPQRGNPRGWRRTWRRVPAGHRSTAAASLRDLFTRRRTRSILPAAVLVLSLIAHAAFVPVLLSDRTGYAAQIATAGRTYLQRVLEADRAKRHSRKATRLSTLPPPPDPETVVSDTLTSEITTDIERVIGDMLGVTVTDKLSRQVTTDLKAELAEAAKTIAEGALSKEEIRKLQEEFRKKAHEKTVRALRRHREDTQIERAKLNVKEWYESRVARQLKGKMYYELFQRTHGGVWHHCYSRSHWGMLRLWYGDCFHYRRIVDRLAELCRGTHYDPRGDIGGAPLRHGRRALPDWPKPSAKLAQGLERVARRIQSGYYGQGWRSAAIGYLRGFHAHRREQMIANEVKEIEAQWAKLFEAIGTFRQRASAGAPEAERAAARTACLAEVRKLHQVSAKVLVPDEGTYTAVNRAVRSSVLRGPTWRTVYKGYVDRLVEAFQPAIVDLARNEFQEGIIVRESGVDKETAGFTREVMGLLRRDVEAVIPPARFQSLIFEGSVNPYVSEITGRPRPPTRQEIERDERALAAIRDKWPADRKGYPTARAEVIAEDFDAVMQGLARALIGKLVEDGRFSSRFYASVESVDYTDRVERRLDARKRALMGRGQDLAQLTDEGVPDPAAAMVALMFGAAKGHGAPLEPVMTTTEPDRILREEEKPEALVRLALPADPRSPRAWGRVTQPKVTPRFKTPFRYEGIPFLANFPKLDGDLGDWGRIRPLVTQSVRSLNSPKKDIYIYAAWNYQGFFFGYHVEQPDHRFAYPQTYESDSLILRRPGGYHWAYKGDFLRLLFDTLDARSANRGEPHAQEFVIFPRGTQVNPDLPGIERVIRAERDVLRRRHDGRVKADAVVFPSQPSPDDGPDGTGPYRVTKFTKTGYTTEVFLPRHLFKVPVFCPGWRIGFEAMVGVGVQPRYNCHMYGRIWANHNWHGHGDLGDKDHPRDWGDLALLGTDPYLAIQDTTGARARALVPGRSYLVTIIDPDRNISLAARDIVVLSAEVLGGPAPTRNDIEVLVLRETKKNSSVFRGYVNTQPGRGREVQGVVEAMPGQQVRLGYIDLADAEGRRNTVSSGRLPVVAGLFAPGGAGPGQGGETPP